MLIKLCGICDFGYVGDCQVNFVGYKYVVDDIGWVDFNVKCDIWYIIEGDV